MMSGFQQKMTSLRQQIDDIIQHPYYHPFWTGKVAGMPDNNSKATIISMAVIASVAGTLLHEGVGHGLIAWLRGDTPTELTSNHLSTLHPDRLVDAGGTLVNLAAGVVSLAASRTARSSNLRYFFWIVAAYNLLAGAGYFLYSGIGGFGDWEEVIRGLPHQVLLRIIMTLFGAGLYLYVVRLLALAVQPFCPIRASYNTVGRLPYLAAGLFECAAGAFDTLGWKIFLLSTVAATFGGSSGLLWADSLFPRQPPERILFVERQPAWWAVAVVVGSAYIFFIGRGIKFAH